MEILNNDCPLSIESIGFADFSKKNINDLNYLILPKGRTELINNIPAKPIEHIPNTKFSILNSGNSLHENLYVWLDEGK